MERDIHPALTGPGYRMWRPIRAYAIDVAAYSGLGYWFSGAGAGLGSSRLEMLHSLCRPAGPWGGAGRPPGPNGTGLPNVAAHPGLRY